MYRIVVTGTFVTDSHVKMVERVRVSPSMITGVIVLMYSEVTDLSNMVKYFRFFHQNKLNNLIGSN